MGRSVIWTTYRPDLYHKLTLRGTEIFIKKDLKDPGIVTLSEKAILHTVFHILTIQTKYEAWK